jgi:uncharacterized protein
MTTSSTTNNALTDKARRLHDILTGYESVLIAFSGGVDSAYLAIAAAEALGSRAIAVTADSPSYPETHRRLALSIASDFGFAHEVIHTAELERRVIRDAQQRTALRARQFIANIDVELINVNG